MTTVDIDEKLRELTKAKARVQGLLQKIEQDVALWERAKEAADESPEHWMQEALLGHSQNNSHNTVNSETRPIPRNIPNLEVPKVNYRVDMITQCENIFPACELLADENDGNLLLNAASQVIREAGISDAKDNGSLSATLNNYLKDRPREWKKMAKGWWKRIATTEDCAEIITQEREELSEHLEADEITVPESPVVGSNEDNLGED